MKAKWHVLFVLLACAVGLGQGRTRLVSPKVEFSVGGALNGTIADFKSVQEAVTATPEGGAVIRIRPGVYREVVHVDRVGVELRGEGRDPAKVVIVYDNGAANACGAACSATMLVTGDDFYAEGITVANDSGRTGSPRGLAAALAITGDRAVLRNVRLLGGQETLIAGSKKCVAEAGCATSRQFFEGCYVEGTTDFIFGNAEAVFEGCEIRSVAHAGVGYVTAQSGQAGEESGFVFDHCRLTADAGAEKAYLGRPSREPATAVFLHTEMGAHIQTVGWQELQIGDIDRLRAANYAEYDSSGPGGALRKRDAFARHLTAAQTKAYEPKEFLRGSDGWDPERVR